MSVRKTVTSTSRSHVVPASSRMARTLAKTLSHWATMSLATTFPSTSRVTPGISLLPRTRGPMPDRNRRFPTRRACGKLPTGSAARVEVTEEDIRFASPLELDADILGLCEKTQRLHATLAPHPGVLHPAEGGAQIPQHPAIHPDDARVETGGDAVRPGEVGGEDRGRQAIG